VSDVGSGYNWRTEEHVERWFAQSRDSQASERTSAFASILGLVAPNSGETLRFIDLGAGDGPLAGLILEFCPFSTAFLVDFSDPMMERGRKELARFRERCEFVSWDMNIGNWPEDLSGPFDAVVSSSAIHHLANARKNWLFSEVLMRLNPEGVFANYDFHRNPSIVPADDDIHARTCATIDETICSMSAAGYRDLQITAHTKSKRPEYEMALISGRRLGHPDAS
jgi:SAM-dependent methyltransferase